MAKKSALTKQQKDMDIFLKGCVNLYGAVTPRQFLKLYNRYNTPKIYKHDLIIWADKLVSQSDNYTIYTNLIVNSRVDKKLMDAIVYYQQGKKYYDATAEEIIAYSNPEYYKRTIPIENMCEYLTKKAGVPLIVANIFIKKLEWIVRTEQPIQATMDLLEKYIMPYDNGEDAFGGTVQFIQEVNNFNCKWANCGYSPLILAKELRNKS